MPISGTEAREAAARFKRGEITEGQLRAIYAQWKLSQKPSIGTDFAQVAEGTIIPTPLDRERSVGTQLGERIHEQGLGKTAVDVAKGIGTGLARGAANLIETTKPGGATRVFIANADRPFSTMAEMVGVGALAASPFLSARKGIKSAVPKVSPGGSQEVVQAAKSSGVSLSEIKTLAEQAAIESANKKMFPYAFPSSKAEDLQASISALSQQRDDILSQPRATRMGEPTRGTRTKLEIIDEQRSVLEAKYNAEVNRRIFGYAPGRVTQTPPVPEVPTPLAVSRSLNNQRPLPPSQSWAKMQVETPELSRAMHPDEISQLPLVDLSEPYSPKVHSLLKLPWVATKGAVDLFSRPEVRLSKYGPVGSAMNDLSIKMETLRRHLTQITIEPLYDVTSRLTRDDRKWLNENFRTVYRAGGDLPNERIQEFAQVWRRAHEIAAETGKKAGLEFGEQANFIPDRITEPVRLAMEAKRGEVWEAIADWAKKEKGIEESELSGIMERLYQTKGDTPVKLSSSLDFKKILGLPDKLPLSGGREVQVLESDILKSVGGYIHEAFRRIAVHETFGSGDTQIRALLDAAGANTKLRELLKDQWLTVQGIGSGQGIYRSAWGRAALGMGALARGAQLSTSVLANLTGGLQPAYKWGLKNVLQQQFDVMKTWLPDRWQAQWIKDAKLRVEVERMRGSWSRHTLRHIAQTEDLGASFGISEKVGEASSGFLKTTGLGAVEANTNKVAGLAANQAVADIFNRLANPKQGKLWKLVGTDEASLIRELKRDFLWSDEDIARIRSAGLTSVDRARISQRASALANAFAEGPGVRPKWMRHPIAQQALAYTSFVRIRGNMAADAVRELSHGNALKMLKFLGYSAVAGEAEIALKGWAKNRERVDKNIYHRLFNDLMSAATFGYVGAAYEETKYSSGVGEFITPPSVDWLTDLVKTVDEAVATTSRRGIHKGYEKFIEAGRKLVPIIDVEEATRKRFVSPREAESERKREAKKRERRQRKQVLP